MTIKAITSPHNTTVKRVAELLRTGVLEDDPDLIVLEGLKLINEAVRSGCLLETLLIQEPAAPPVEGARETLVLTAEVMKKLSVLECPSRVIALIRVPPPPELAPLLQKARTLLVLDRIQDPGNLGTMIRTAEALGVDGLLLLKGSCSARNLKTLRAAMGSAFRLPLYEKLAADDTLARLREHGFSLLAADMAGTPAHEYRFPEKIALILGSEGGGIESQLRSACDQVLSIPMAGAVESLNVATSAAILLYERFTGRQRRAPPG
jgi:TrmH family RNA methyltransferase